MTLKSSLATLEKSIHPLLKETERREFIRLNSLLKSISQVIRKQRRHFSIKGILTSNLKELSSRELIIPMSSLEKHGKS